jgi:predicted enzyme related to lactoylglutathione lyase
MKKIMMLLALAAVCCGGATHSPAPTPTAETKGVRIKLTSIYVDDQDKALRFYTDVLGFARKDDVTNGYRWLTVQDAAGMQLQLAANTDPAGKAYQDALFAQSQPAVMFFTDDLQADYDRIKANGAEFTMPPTDVTMSKIAMLKDTCGNLVQLTQLLHP